MASYKSLLPEERWAVAHYVTTLGAFQKVGKLTLLPTKKSKPRLLRAGPPSRRCRLTSRWTGSRSDARQANRAVETVDRHQLKRKLPAFALFNLAFCVGVIVFGAYVRASGSGAGCGSHWPLCNGVLVQSGIKQKTWIEMSHRMTSGLLLLTIGAQAAWAWKLLGSGVFAFRAALLSLLAVIIEAMIGAFIVLLGYVDHDKSIDRVLSMSLHLANTLLAALTCALLSIGHTSPRWRWPDRSARWWPFGLLVGFGVLGGLGAVAALGDTLFSIECAGRDRATFPVSRMWRNGSGSCTR